MGEAKRRRDRELQATKFTKPIKRARFNIYSMGTRLSTVAYMCREESWWASDNEDLLGMVALDLTDNDYFWMILARDRIGRFRCATLRTDFSTQPYAETQLRVEMARLIEEGGIAEFGEQGDETNSPLDPFEVSAGMNPDALHPYFKMLLEEPGREPARVVIRELALWLAPADPHLVREFQTTGFDQRLWEFYLWAAFKEFYLDVEQLEAPDFRCIAPGVDFTVEATTVAPSTGGVLEEHPNPKTDEEIEKFLRDYMPMKFGSALTGKLNKTNAAGEHYWEREVSRDKPFAIAIADFHKAADENNSGSMTYSQSALWQYLYGSRVSWRYENDRLITETENVKSHKYKEKEIPSGFFDLPNAENVSAIIFSNAGTIAKFDRMGVAAGFGVSGYKYFRMGLKYNPDPDAVMGGGFVQDVADENYKEYWTQEIQVFHNPNARHALPFEAMLGATHHYFENGQLVSHAPDDAVLSSYTMLMKIEENDAFGSKVEKNGSA